MLKNYSYEIISGENVECVIVHIVVMLTVV